MPFKRPAPRSPRVTARRSGLLIPRAGAAAEVTAQVAAALAALLLLAPSLAPSSAVAQQGDDDAGAEGSATWLPDRTSFAPLLAAPREVALRGSLILAERPDLPADFEGRNLEAEVALGHRFGVVRLQRGGEDRPEITLGFEVGVFNRFHLETPERDLIGADYRVGLPLSVRGGGWEARLTPMHVSSHIGDDFLARFAAPGDGQFTRDGVELVAARSFGRVRAYGSGTWNFHVNEGVPEVEGAFGLEWDPGPSDASPTGFAAWPFAAVDLRFSDRTRGPASTGVAGATLRVRGTLLRLELRGHAGPSPLGQLRGTDETFLGLGLRIEP